MEKSPACLFCSIVAKKISAEVVCEDDRTIAFLDVHPRAPGHVLVIPKRHAATLLDLPADELGRLFGTVQRVERMIAAGLSPHGFTVGINQGRAAGQEVGHFHVHIIPRFENDGGSSLQGVVDNPPSESLPEIGRILRNHKNND